MDGERPPLLFTFLMTAGLCSPGINSVLKLDSEQYVNQLGFIFGTTYLSRCCKQVSLDQLL